MQSSSFLVLTGLHGQAGRDVQVVDTYERVGAIRSIDTELSRLRDDSSLRESNPGCELDACLRDMVKLRRAYGGCLGSQRRRRTWTAAISSGEPLTGFDPEISEWGNPRTF